jgi:ABC-type multidrug transport system fused ATPase/permease subunit
MSYRGVGFGGRGGGPRLDDVPDVEGAAYNPQVVSRAMTYMRPYRRQLFFAVVLTIFAAAMGLLAPYLVKVAIDEHIATGDFAGLTWVVLLTLLVYAANYLATWRQTIIVSEVGQSIIQTLRQQLFHKLQRLSLGYYDRNLTGVIVSRLINDVSVINDLVTHGMINLFADVFLLAATIGIMLWLSPSLALATLGVMPVMAVAVWVFTQRAKVAFRVTRQKIGAVTADLQETISGARVVQAFAREEVSQDQFDRLNMENRDANVQANSLSAMLMPVVEFSSALAVVAVIWYGGSLVMAGQVTLGVLVAFLSYITRFFQPIRDLTQFYNQMQAAMAGGERVFELLDEPETVVESPNAITLPTVRGEVELRNVSFAYRDRAVLHDVSFRAEAGQTVALVGHTGAGKTTIASLVARFYDPTPAKSPLPLGESQGEGVPGAVLLDGHDLRTLSFQTLRRNIAVVLQDNFLFAGTIADNIRFSRPDATQAEVEAAARVAQAHHFISRLPQGYETPVMERAANLSLGQRQLIALARAVLADPRVLILDEATSSVDPRTERLLQRAIQRLMQGRTNLVIAHRLSTIRSADLVLVIDDGRIVERGTHEELLALRGTYHRLHLEQFAALPSDGAVPAA